MCSTKTPPRSRHRTTRLARLPETAAACLLIVLAGCTRGSSGPAQTSSHPREEFGQKASVPDLFRIDAPHLYALVLSEKSPLTVINIWATSCGPCQEELPMMAAVAKTYADRGVTVIPVSVDDPEDEARIPARLSELGFRAPYFIALGDLEAFKRAMHPKWPGNIPVSFVLDDHARHRYYFNAEVYENELTPVLDGLLSGSNPDGQSHFKVAPGVTLQGESRGPSY